MLILRFDGNLGKWARLTLLINLLGTNKNEKYFYIVKEDQPSGIRG